MKRNALYCGMTMEHFWLGNPQDYYLFIDNYNRKQKETDETAWLNGVYVLYAVQQSLSTKQNAKIFPQRPLSEKQNKLTLRDKIMAAVERHNQYYK